MMFFCKKISKINFQRSIMEKMTEKREKVLIIEQKGRSYLH